MGRGPETGASAAIPGRIKDASGLPHLFDAMRKSGFDRQTLSKFAFDNWLRVFALTWKNGPSS
ncbi:membrane dipeptidase [Rhizobium laguerreae]|uniref:membrane dipeptidase n=1 Tax=Rhizobium laguerreae TaxID=1076926 RepID=UPI0021B0A7DE|nr:membrane dipeptidase [Rhizobium laguerreae]